jgi:hypothetical protein
MNTYQSLSAIAHNLKTSESELLDLERRSWIRRVAKNEIGRVLAKEPPYSLADIPKVLGRPVPL